MEISKGNKGLRANPLTWAHYTVLSARIVVVAGL